MAAINKLITRLRMNQRRKKRGLLLNNTKRSQKPSKSCFSMHSRPSIFSIMCKCSHSVKKEHCNKSLEAPIRLSESMPQQRHSSIQDSVLSAPSKVSVVKRGKLKKTVTIGSKQASLDIDGDDDEAEWPPSVDEDYIVFCFEEDGEFHVVMEENSSPRPHDLKVEEERFYFSPRLQSDGIRSSTRFKQEEVESRDRVDGVIECTEMEEIKSRSQSEFVHRLTVSADSSQSDWEHILELIEVDQEVRLSSSTSHEQDGQMSAKEANTESPSSKKTADDEESVYLSSESQQAESQDSDEQSGRESAETSDSTNMSEIEEVEEDEQIEDNHEESESGRLSIVSSNMSNEESNRFSSSSFEFPALQWEWIGSPDIWPRSVTPKIIPYKKHKSHKVCLRLC